jgi:hypothetical protein
MALIATRAEPAANQIVAPTLGPKPAAVGLPQRELGSDSGGPWILVPGAERIARRLRARFPNVGDRWTPQLGVKTGADDVFLLDRKCSGTRPAIRGRDIVPWRCEPRRFVVWTHGVDGKPLTRLPTEVLELLAPHDERLRRRADYRGGAAWQLFRTSLGLAPYRVIWPDIAKRLAAAVPERDAVPLNTVYGIATRDACDALALAALFNTTWITGLARLVADPARGGFRRFNARVIRGLPIPASGPVWDQLARRGSRCEPADDLIAEAFELDLTDRRALAADSV